MQWKQFFAVIAAVSGLALGQTETGTPLAFEVASVKVSSGRRGQSGSGGGQGSPDPGRYHSDATTLLDLIATAYHVNYFQVVSKLPLERATFDVVAKVPAGTTREQFRIMLQNLLAERFHLKLHQESREFPAWELSIAKSGLKLKESVVTEEAKRLQ